MRTSRTHVKNSLTFDQETIEKYLIPLSPLNKAKNQMLVDELNE